MSKEEEMQKLAVQYQVLQANVRLIEERQQFLLKHLEELQRTKAAIEELEHTKIGDAFVPVGNGNFLFGSVSDTNNVIVGIGGGIAIKKTRKDAVEILEGRLREMNKILSELAVDGERIFSQMNNIQKKADEFQK
jgi:prefoldin alpha subunit